MRRLLVCLIVLWACPAIAADITVCAAACTYTNSQLQAAINASACGDTIKLQDDYNYGSPYYLPPRPGCASYSTLTRTSAAPTIYDVIPNCYQQGPSFAAEQALKATCFAALKVAYETSAPIVSVTQSQANLGQGSPFFIEPNGDYWKVLGLEFRFEGTVTAESPSYGLVIIGLDRNTFVNAGTLADQPHHIIFDRNSFHGTSTGQLVRAVLANGNDIQFINNLVYDVHYTVNDSQCYMSYSSVGPHLIENNYLSCAGENVLFGGADPQVTGQIPSDITQTRNYFTKEWIWWTEAAQVGYVFSGQAWYTKNHSECKNCQRNAIYGNVIENVWQQNQSGESLLFQSLADGPNCTWCTVRDISIYNNVIRNVGGALAVAGDSYNSYTGACATMGGGITFEHNLAYNVRAIFGPALTGGGSGFRFIGGGTAGVGYCTQGGVFDGVVINHNTFDNESSMGNLGGLGDTFTNVTITNNIGRAKNNFAAISFTCPCNGGTEGLNILIPSGLYTVSHNAFFTAGGEWAWPADNWFPGVSGDVTATLALYKAELTDRDGYDWSIKAGSIYKAGGARDSTTGTDLGVDMSLLFSGDPPPTPSVDPPVAPKFRLHVH